MSAYPGEDGNTGIVTIKVYVQQLMRCLELKDFLQTHRCPRFPSFIREHQNDFALWSVGLAANSAARLHGIWLNRYKELLEDDNRDIQSKKVAYDRLRWDTIIVEVNRRRNLAHTFKEQALDLLVVSAEPAAAEGQRVIHATSSTIPAKRSADGDLDEEDECNRASTSNIETTSSDSEATTYHRHPVIQKNFL
ncbi:hypothetical protein BDB00DRAFT_240219 [Zychaea mexicana]|uniref:uncharacterized protein n=1 Tax=Zychaea mexicana TaxID=64656 RepID=UPI0022FF2B36|nr:uncharacterized protein BDB00DRAFT_240219 [Zychaea mexicana]KAI9471400.1 hypothetical protein BDB00DRAFT_240219 [Zychaea mexicana]